MKTSLLAIFVLAAVAAHAQTHIKLYQNTDYNETTQNDYISSLKEHHLRFTRLSIAVSFVRKNTLVHQLELFVPQINQKTQLLQYPINYSYGASIGYDNRASCFSFRYEISKVFSKAASALKFSAGVGLNPYYSLLKNNSTIATPSGKESHWYGCVVNIIPAITCIVSSRLRLEISLPLKIYDLRFTTFRIKNPALPIRQQQNTGNEHLFLEQAYTLRFGIAYKIN
jgi:hypothetical protein